MIPHFETAIGVVDGINTIFFTSLPYLPGTTAVFLNGLLLEPTLVDGWLEIAPGLGQFQMKEPPRTTDVVRVYYLDQMDIIVVQEVCEITGILEEEEPMLGVLEEEESVEGAVEEFEELEGIVELC